MAGVTMRVRRAILLTGLAPIALHAPAAFAQDTPSVVSESEQDTVEASGQIVVTGSRIVRDGYEAPTPVTVATAESLIKSAPTSIPDGLVKLPQFTGSPGPNRSQNTFATPNHGNILNLRGLGGIRTLILVDGIRVSPSTYIGNVNVDLLPQMLVERVDVVTAGASASYGSDAVSGVVNFVLDKDFTGVKGMAQLGTSTRDDNHTNRFGLAGGVEVGANLHVVLAAEHIESDGYLVQDRPKLARQGIAVGSVVGGPPAGGASNPIIFVDNARFSFATFGGLVSSGPFANTVFTAPGQYRPVNRGTPTGSAGYFIGGDYYFAPGTVSAAAASESNSLFGRVSLEVSPTIEAYAQFMGSLSEYHYNSLPNLLLVPPIFSGNAFLPAPLQAQLTATNTPSFSLRKMFSEFGPIPAREKIRNYQVTTGLSGSLGAFDWNLDYSHGNSVFRLNQPNQFEQTKLAAALDAVVDPGSGNVVCRPVLNPDPAVRARYSGCAPLNPFGFGAASAAARDYVMGTSTYRAETTTDDVVASISGDIFELPAGPVSIALGGEYRKQKLDLVSNSDPAVFQDMTGLRGLAPNATRFYLTNTGIASGSNNVKEVFGEVAVPVLADIPGVRSFDLNGAIRYTDYSTSGGVTTWKVGGIWAPVDGLKFRATRSRDIRAPTPFDLFAGSQFIQSALLDPHTNTTGSFFQRQSGNPDLDPEIASTLSIGAVAQPAFLPGFSVSVDYYEIKVDGAISTLSAAQLLLDCEQASGNAPSCAAITRPLPFSDRSAANYPTEVRVAGVNISTLETGGIDLDASYRTDFADGNLGIRLFANWVDTFTTQLSESQPVIEYAGFSTLGGRFDTTIPKFKGSFSVDYDNDRWGLFVQENLIGKIKLGPTLIYAQPDLPEFLTTDATLTVHLDELTGLEADFFLSVTNLFDETPPDFFVNTVPGLGVGTLVNLYDSTGRQFTTGVRFKF